MTKLLAATRANTNLTEQFYQAAIQAEETRNFDAVNTLAKNKAIRKHSICLTSGDGTKYEGINALHLAVALGEVGPITDLIRGADAAFLNCPVVITDINGNRFEGVTPLYFAVMLGDKKVAAALLKASRIDPNCRITRSYVGGSKFEDDTPIHRAAELNRPDIIEILRQRGADLDSKAITIDPDGSTRFEGERPLHRAAAMGRTQAVEALVENANVNAEDCNGSTPFVYAVLGNQAATAASLFRAGAKVEDGIMQEVNQNLAFAVDNINNGQDVAANKQAARGWVSIGAKIPKDTGYFYVTRGFLRDLRDLAGEQSHGMTRSNSQ